MKKVLNKAKGSIVNIEMNNYVIPNPTAQLNQSGKYITNGVDNEFFRTIEQRYIGSPTNASVIDAFTNYTYGEGLQSNIDINKYISKGDVRLMVHDLEKHGGFSFQVVYAKDNKNLGKIYHTPVKDVAIVKGGDLSLPPTRFVYCFDWTNKTKFKPYEIPAFGEGGIDADGKKESEIAYFRRPTANPLFPLPSYVSALQYCAVEEELSNYYINHIKNNFCAGKVININGQSPSDEETREEWEIAIKNKVTSTTNAGGILVSFNDNKDSQMTVDNIEITDAYSQFKFLSEESRDKILLAHKVSNPILFGVRDGSGLGNNAEEMNVALKNIYRSQVNPNREILIDGLLEVLTQFFPNITLSFKDFEELNVETPKAEPTKLSALKVSFDFDDTLTTLKGKTEALRAIDAGDDVYIISARDTKSGMYSIANQLKIPIQNIYATGSNTEKLKKIRELDIDVHWDNDKDIVQKLGNKGKLTELRW